MDKPSGMKEFYAKARQQARLIAATDLNIARSLSDEGMNRRVWATRRAEAHRIAADIIEAVLFKDTPKWEAEK